MSTGYGGETASNPFYCDEEEGYDDGSDNINQIKVKIQRSEVNQLKSLGRANRVLQETEEIGYTTAEELLHQGEQLKNTEEKLDSIKAISNVNQRHLNNIKSVFGSLKNKFFGRSETPAVTPKASEIQHSRLRETLDDEYGGKESSIPVAIGGGKIQEASLSFHSRWQDRAGAAKLENELSDEDEDEWDSLRDISHTASRRSKQAAMDDELRDIGAGLGRLKQLGLGMNEELARQDDRIGRLLTKTDDCDIVLADQNNQMKKMLR